MSIRKGVYREEVDGKMEEWPEDVFVIDQEHIMTARDRALCVYKGYQEEDGKVIWGHCSTNVCEFHLVRPKDRKLDLETISDMSVVELVKYAAFYMTK
ncbi:hypothetical protein [Sutcliffiella horikoshii]|uniref:hypothetical protein n=1 Tax=Sutcliffiella horikoshii TaxID=79883 RepID=UPI00384BA13C